MKLKKQFLLASCAVLLTVGIGLPVNAQESNVQNSEQVSCYIIPQSDKMSITPYADKIVTKYRVSNGVLQYRRWNQTQGYWVDPDWIDMT